LPVVLTECAKNSSFLLQSVLMVMANKLQQNKVQVNSLK